MNSTLAFLKAIRHEFRHTGACLPSSRFVAAAMTEDLNSNRPGWNILEVGTGTGAISKAIILNMREDDTLTLCDINPEMIAGLKTMLEKLPEYNRHKERIHIICGPVQDLPDSQKFDLIISSVPFLNFDAALTKSILEKYHQLSKPDTKLKYFQYVALKNICQLCPGKRGQRVKALSDYLENQKLFQQSDSKIVWLNLPPARINCCAQYQ